ncbi:MAG: M48 family metalloprotease, partial [Hyphococcus sp.]
DADVAQLAGQAAQLYVLRFSRTQEYEADQVGVRLLASADYDPIGEAAFLDTLGAWSSLEARIAGRQAPPEYLSTHPNSAERVRRAAQEANVLRQAGAVSTQINRNRYLNAIDGMIYGDDPVKQGFIRGTEFIHPQIGIAFRAPAGFELQNSSQAVYGRSPSGAQMQFLGAGSNDGPAALINGPLSQSLQIDLSPARNVRINGRDAAIGAARANTQNGPVDVIAHAIRWEGTTHYVFVWVSPANQTRQWQGQFDQTAQSLQMVDGAAVNVPPARRVEVVTVQRGDNASSLGRLMAFPSYQVERFRIMNALEPTETLRAGERVKLVR